jgi:biotin carboxyl carrier protein
MPARGGPLDGPDRRGGGAAVKREFKIKLGGAEFPVVAEGDTVTVDGRTYTVEVTEEGQVLVDGIAHDVALEGERATVDEGSYDVQAIGLALGTVAPAPVAVGAAAPGGAEASAGAVLAIMPGKIIRVMVEVGQEIEEGQPICVLEAMKMENELHARQAGTVKAVYVKPGDDVEKDQVLAEIE